MTNEVAGNLHGASYPPVRAADRHFRHNRDGAQSRLRARNRRYHLRRAASQTYLFRQQHRQGHLENIKLENAHGSVVVSPGAGASLQSLRVKVGSREYELLSGGRDEPHSTTELKHGNGSFIMAPWVNRIRDGRLVAADGEHMLPVNSGLHAIHGTVRGREWQVVEQSKARAVVQVSLEEPWPYRGKVVYRFGLHGASFRQTLEVHAADGEREFPAGVGWHPWFARKVGSGDISVQADVEAQWELDKDVTPTGKIEETPLTRKLRAGGKFGFREVDGCFRLSSRDSAAVVRWPEVSLRITGSPEIGHVMLYSPENAICVEPQTTTVNAQQLAVRGVPGTGARTAKPGKPLVASTTWTWGAAAR